VLKFIKVAIYLSNGRSMYGIFMPPYYYIKIMTVWWIE
jgi:hypothetical protein